MQHLPVKSSPQSHNIVTKIILYCMLLSYPQEVGPIYRLWCVYIYIYLDNDTSKLLQIYNGHGHNV